MPVNLVPANPQIFQQHRERARASIQVKKVPIRGPWAGYMPDIDPYNAPISGCADITGLVARPSRFGTGEVLRPDAGYAPTGSVHASAGLPLDTNTAGASTTQITLLAQFNRTTPTGTHSDDHDVTLLAVKAGNGTAANTLELYRLLPSDGTTWQKVSGSFSGDGGTDPALSLGPRATREILPDWAVMPAGATARTAYSGQVGGSGVIEPVFVWCGLAGGAALGDRVMMYPVNTGSGTEDGDFEPLTDRFGAVFYAQTVEYWNGRLYFGNTTDPVT